MADTASTSGVLARLNQRFARKAALIFGTMGMFYTFVAYSLLPLIDPAHQDKYLLYSNAIQLVALPLLMVGTNILGRDSEQRARETHDAVMEELGLLHQALGITEERRARLLAEQAKDAQ